MNKWLTWTKATVRWSYTPTGRVKICLIHIEPWAGWEWISLVEVAAMSNAATTLENLAQFLIKFKSVSTAMKQTYFEVFPRKKGKGMSIWNCQQSQQSYSTEKKKNTGTTHVDQHRVGKAMVCAHSSTVLSSREQTTNTEAQLSFASHVKKTENNIKTTMGRKQGSGHSAHWRA